MHLMEQGCAMSSCDPRNTLYKGKFKSLIRVNDEDGVYYIQLKKHQAHRLDVNKNQEYDCDASSVDGAPCVGKYYR